METSHAHDWVWEAFSLYDSLYSYMPPFIMTMNTKAQKLFVERSKFKRFLWCTSIFINVFFLAFFCSMYVVVKWIMRPHSVSPVQAAAALGVTVVTVLVGYTCVIHYIYREEHVYGCNAVLALHLKTFPKQKPKRPKVKRSRKEMLLGLVMKGMVWGFWCVPAVVPIAIFEGIDPLRVFLLDLIPAKWMDQYPIHVSLALLLSRFLLMIMAAMEISRFFAMFFLLLISGIIIYVDCIDKFLVDKVDPTVAISLQDFKDMRSIRMIIHILNPVLTKEICCLMFTGFVIAVGTNIAAVQCYELFPWYMYTMIVLVFIVTLIIIYCTLPFGTEVNEKTTFVLDKWKDQLEHCSNSEQMRLTRKELKSLRPVSVRCASFFKLKCDTKSTYFEAILNTSCDFNISVDFNALFKNGF